MAERSGDGLQNHVLRFDSGCRLIFHWIMDYVNRNPSGSISLGYSKDTVCTEKCDNPIDMTYEQISKRWNRKGKASSAEDRESE